MTGFVCAFNRDMAPLDRQQFRDRLDTIRDIGRHGSWAQFQQDWLALGECVHRDTPEVPEQVRAATARGCVLVGDIRLDNREDLLAALDLENEAPSDAELLLAAYCAWGTHCVDRLHGEFSFAIWDEGKRRLFAARDPMGERGIYLVEIGSQLVLTNEMRIARKWPGVTGMLDEVVVASALVRRGMHMRSAELTFYEGVRQLPPGHVLVATQDDLRTQQYWSIMELQDRPLPSASRADMLAEFRSIFDDAVRKRLRSTRPIGCHLSGGLDSTTISCLAASQLQESGEELHCFSHATRAPIPDISATRTVRDEIYVEAAAAQYPNIRSHWAHGDQRPLLSDVVTQFHYNGTLHPNHFQTWWDEINSEAAGLGLGALLMGTTGNLTASWLGPRRIISPYRLARTKLRGFVAPVFDRFLPDHFPGLRPEVAKRIGLRDRVRHVAAELRAQPRATSLSRGLSGMYRSYTLGRFDLELRDPMGDRRVVEFCLRAPIDLFQRDGERRLLIRDSMRGVVPDMVLDRNSRQLQAADWVERIGNERPALLARIDTLSRSDAVNQFLDLTKVRTQLAETQPHNRADMKSLGHWNNTILHPIAIGCILEWIGEGCPNPA